MPACYVPTSLFYLSAACRLLEGSPGLKSISPSEHCGVPWCSEKWTSFGNGDRVHGEWLLKTSLGRESPVRYIFYLYNFIIFSSLVITPFPPPPFLTLMLISLSSFNYRDCPRISDYRKKLMIAIDAANGMHHLHRKGIQFLLTSRNLLLDLGDSERPKCKVSNSYIS